MQTGGVAGLSGIEAKIALAVLLAGATVDIEVLGAELGVKRRQTLTDAARRLEGLGLVRLAVSVDSTARSVALAPSLLVSTVSSLTDRERASAPSAADGLEDRSSIYLSRYPSFVGHPNTLPLSDNATVLSQNPLNSTALSDNTTALSDNGTLLSDNATVLDDPKELAFMRVEDADALPGGDKRDHQRYSPYVIRHKAQLTALADYWKLVLGTPIAENSLDLLMAEADKLAVPVAQMIGLTAERIASGQSIRSPWGYIRSALRNQREKEAQAQAQPVYHDPDELLPMTPEIQAQLDDAKAVAAKYNLWGDD